MVNAGSTPLESLPLPPSALAKLAEAGFGALGDLEGLSPAEFAAELQLSLEAATKLMVEIRSGGIGGQPAPVPRSALELLAEERSAGCLATFVPELDALLGGGVPLRMITEFSGVAGVGKTQLAMQLALDARIPAVFNGLAGECIYIDTEGSFMVERAMQIADGIVSHLRYMAQRDECAEQMAAAAALDASALLDGIHYYRVHDAAELLAAVRALPALVVSRPIRAVVVDSVAFHFRYGETYGRRQQLLSQMATSLTDLASRSNLAVVLVNHVTMKADPKANAAAVAPALGEAWAHMCGVQLLLQWHGGVRHATLYKGRAPGSAAFRVCDEGVRSCAAARTGAEPAGHSDGRGLKRPAEVSTRPPPPQGMW